ncbi:hypothetical protein Q31b_32390 [Novipirellula aureliae]|uniref:Uncharacterized protein n=1 Tax=Novipirellula aureliae TaxID=2527966 RepID=A0A5C6DRK5_9BACT|nr:hypothetical protein [Novipirellula aureliae]TWU39923.1 hypothetical protein Q31b_32390 [Novipirellula aureliae]
MRFVRSLLMTLLVAVPVAIQAQTPEWSPHRGGVVPQGSPWAVPVQAVPVHPVIRSPNTLINPGKKDLGRQLVEQYAETHPPRTSIRRRKLPAPATIPEAIEQPRWKTPYSYGYFGANPKPIWTKHHGYRDNYTQWTRH